jgi:hypothetical protein
LKIILLFLFQNRGPDLPLVFGYIGVKVATPHKKSLILFISTFQTFEIFLKDTENKVKVVPWVESTKNYLGEALRPPLLKAPLMTVSKCCDTNLVKSS